MPLQLILGSSGAGKSHYAYGEMIRQAGAEEKTNFFVIVPEQFTMETQKDFVKMSPTRGIMNIDVLSFLRLSYRIFDETGNEHRKVLEDTGKTLILRKVLENCKGQLLYFGANIRKPGFVDEIKSLLSEFYQYGRKEEDIASMIDLAAGRPLLESKLKDMLVIYREFRDYMEAKYITSEEVLDVLYGLLDDSVLIRDSVVCLDGFTGFTPVQYQLLSKILRFAKKVYVTVTIDEREDITRVGEEHQLFHLSKKTIHRLLRIAEEEKVEILDPIYPAGQCQKNRRAAGERVSGAWTADRELWRFRDSPAMGALEKNLFRYPMRVYQKAQDCIHIRGRRDKREEVAFVMERMRSLIIERGMKYRDFAVVSGNIEMYQKIVEREFHRSEIPFFMDSKRNILDNPLVIMVDALLVMEKKNYDYESVFHFLRSGMVPISRQDADFLENYMMAFGIRGFKKLSQPFTRLSQGQTEEELAFVEETRKKLLSYLEPSHKVLGKRKQTVLSYVNAIYERFLALGVQDKLKEYEAMFLEKGDRIRAKEYAQVYRMVLEVMEKMTELLGDEVVTLQELKDLLDTGFQEVKAGFIPFGVDQVMVGDIERTRLKDIKVLFFIGVNDGVIPKNAGGGGILSDMEREMLKQNRVELAPTKREQVYTEQFYLYLNLTKPSQEVYLTYFNSDTEGRAAKPSYLIGRILKMFPDAAKEEKEEELERILAGEAGKGYLLSYLPAFTIPEYSPSYWNEIYGLFLREEGSRAFLLRMVSAVWNRKREGMLSQAVAKALYGSSFTGSVTRLEQFAACAYAHFLSYGLRLKERQEFKVHIPDIGNIFHSALELFSKRLAQEGCSWQDITEEEQQRLAGECVEAVTEEYGNRIFHSSSRNESMVSRVTRILKRTLWAMTRQIQAGDFEPAGYEMRFSYMDELESVRIPLDEGEMLFNGRIDRLDLCKEEDKIYVRVIDYKSGQTVFDVQDIYYGLKLQLTVYLSAAVEKVERQYPQQAVLPAGVFYYHIDDPMLEAKHKEFPEAELLKKLKLDGLANGEASALSHLDRAFHSQEGIPPQTKSLVLPVETLKDGSFARHSSVATEEQIGHMMDYVRRKMKEFGNRILSGEIRVNPFQQGEQTACTYCAFRAICGFDKKMADQYRKLSVFSEEEIWRKFDECEEMDRGTEKGH